MRIYLDTVIVIYDVESHPEFAPLVRRRLSNGSNEFFITEIIRMECLVHPLRLDDQARVRALLRVLLSTAMQFRAGQSCGR